MPAIVTFCNKPHCRLSSDYPPIILRLSSDQDSSEVFGSDEGRRHVTQHFRRGFALRKIVGRVRSRVVIVLRRGAGQSSADAACRFASSTAQSSVASVLEDFSRSTVFGSGVNCVRCDNNLLLIRHLKSRIRLYCDTTLFFY